MFHRLGRQGLSTVAAVLGLFVAAVDLTHCLGACLHSLIIRMESLALLRKDAHAIFKAAVQAVDPKRAVKNWLHRDRGCLEVAGRIYDLTKARRIYVVGAGKAAARMALAVEELLGEKIYAGFVVVKDGYALPTRKIRIAEAGHPIPDSRGVLASKVIIRLLEEATSDDLVLCLISGGASALLSAPIDSISLEDKQLATRLLLNCGAKIQEINAIRKHASKLKGGRLAQLAYPSQVVSLILSDVIGDPIDSIASGPTAPDPTTYADCLEIIERYDLLAKMPATLIETLEAGRQGVVAETPKPGDLTFAKVHNVVVGNNRSALSAAKEKAEALGYHAVILSSSVEGESTQAALFHTAIAKEIKQSGSPVSPPACVLSGGETTVHVQGSGLGGRNQEFATAAALEIADLEGVVVLSAGTDGTDGPTDAAGGIVDGTTVGRARRIGLEPAGLLRRNDSYRFLDAVGDLVVTGPTFTNVMDIHIVLVA